jgi:hypothetical protein
MRNNEKMAGTGERTIASLPVNPAAGFMSIFEEMHPFRNFASPQQFTELKRMLGEAISRGHVEAIPVIRRWEVRVEEEWYRDKETGDIYSLVTPVPPADGWWERVDIDSFNAITQRPQ